MGHRSRSLLKKPVRVELERMSSLEGTAPAPRTPGCRNDEAELLREAEAHAVVGAFLGLVAWWVNDAPGLSAQVVDQVFQRPVFPVSRSLAGQNMHRLHPRHSSGWQITRRYPDAG